MTDTAQEPAAARGTAARRHRRARSAWLRANLFNSSLNTILTLAGALSAGGDDPAGHPLGLRRRDLERRQRPRLPRRRRLLGLHRREGCASSCSAAIPTTSIGARCFVVVIFVALILASCDRRLWGRRLGASVARRAGRCRRADVGRRPRPDLCRDRAVERPAADPDPRGRRHGVRLSAGDPAGARAALASCRRCGRSASAISSWCAACR